MARTRNGGSGGCSIPHVSPTVAARRMHATTHVVQPPSQQSLHQTNLRLVKRKRSKRQHTRKGAYSTTSIQTLPRDSLVEVVATVAAHSFIDLHTIKLCCKDFLAAAPDRYVWQRVSLDTFPLIQWSPNNKETSFLNRCREYGNIESLYREGLRKYFNYPNGKIDDGVRILKIAAEKGHNEVKYVCGMISLCSDDDEVRKLGLEYMHFLRKLKCVVSCRKKVKQLLKSVWKNNVVLVRNSHPLCKVNSTCKGWRVKKDRWVLVDDDDDDDDDMSLCEYCRWDHELEFFYRLFNI
ncbi:uncharacterized protein LOC130713112 [Lotus japonicus]|uniref:uncharacterized protein LOC130713112 n=1 Tax=Lotus japonicus TaxID=34305 RepID=UPI0025841211|nr:uncharacterized protein LOC130713112 [Lotus japonicus]